MPGDVQLTALQTEPAPLDYVVPQSAIVRVKSVHALFTDNGAAGDWLPAVRLISDSDHTIALASDQGSKVTAGDDADASFFPGVKHAAVAGGTTGSWLRVIAGPNTPSGSIILQNGTAMDIDNFDTNDPTRFVQTDGQHWTMKRGVYVMTGALRTTGAVVTANADFTVGISSGSGFVAYAFGGNAERILTLGWGSMTIGDQGALSSWRMNATGADTHNIWVGEADIFYVPGT